MVITLRITLEATKEQRAILRKMLEEKGKDNKQLEVKLKMFSGCMAIIEGLEPIRVKFTIDPMRTVKSCIIEEDENGEYYLILELR